MSGHCRKHCQRLDPDHWGRCVGRCGEQWAEICPRCAEAEQRDAWWDEAFQRQARTAEQYRAEGRAEERERIADMVESLPPRVWAGIGDPVPYRALTPAEIADKIRGETWCAFCQSQDVEPGHWGYRCRACGFRGSTLPRGEEGT